MTPADLYGILPAARTRSRPAGHKLTVDRAGGQKLTIGARASARYGRLYIKGDRVRHELELKAEVAGTAWDRLRTGETPRVVWTDEYRRLIEWQQS